MRLKYTKAPYGPYAENLRHVLRAVEGHLISGYADGGDAPDKQLELVPGAVADASTFLENNADTRTRLDRVSNLVAGFESSFGLELLSTVHWVIKREGVHTVSEVIDKTYTWNDRKKHFSARQIELAVDVLCRKGWVDGVTIGHV